MLTDEQLAKKAKTGDNEAYEYILKKYKGLVRKKCKAYYLENSSDDDVLQEGMIGLFFAIRDFDENKNDSFAAFASVCIKNRLLSAVKKSTRKKDIPRKKRVSLEDTITNDSGSYTLAEILKSNRLTPEEKLIADEKMASMRTRVDKILSLREKKVLGEYLKGKSYQEIADLLQMDKKSVDNAMQRIRNKIKKR